LQKENDELRRLLTDPSSRTLSSDSTRRTASIGTYADTRGGDRDYSLKRRKPGDGVYISPSDTPPHGNESSRPPPPLTIPQPLSHHYGNIGSSSTAHGNNNQGGSLFSLQAPPFQMPNTPSGSSATSSPPFSPAQMQASSHLPMDHRPHISDHHGMSSYSQPAPHYNSVKVEDDHYNTASHPTHHSSMHYSYSNHHNQSQGHNGMDWHTAYSSERAPLHR